MFCGHCMDEPCSCRDDMIPLSHADLKVLGMADAISRARNVEKAAELNRLAILATLNKHPDIARHCARRAADALAKIGRTTPQRRYS